MGWHDVTIPSGSVFIQAQLTGPEPITYAELRLNGRLHAAVSDVDLRSTTDHLLRFTWLVGPSGRYRVNLFAKDDRGCSDTTGLPRIVTVP